mmetsp:Transcript_65604/g.211664  ORF Transcript_65604/g.211664 Transcript_65604/m.211664 type:complete len:403 (-) Transcript_65604:93-1301(-)
MSQYTAVSVPKPTIYGVPVELPSGEVETVNIDLDRGPLVKQADGSWTYMKVCDNPVYGVPTGTREVKENHKSWPEMSRSEQDVTLIIVARKNRAMRELLESPGYKPPALPDFLAGFKPNHMPWQTLSEDKQNSWWTKMSQPPKEVFEQAEEDQPVLVCWYSGGLDKNQGREQLSGILEAAGKAGLKHRMVMDFPDAFGIEGEGSIHWGKYVDKVVEEIDKDPDRHGRKLILFGHSRGATSAMTVATRLGRRVLKVYVLSSGAPVPGEPSPFQMLSEGFKKSTDVDLLKWFCSLNPVPVLIRMMQSVEKGDMKISDSGYLKEKVALMKRQYVNAIWPDMQKDFKVINVPIMAVAGKQDQNESKESMERWKIWSTNEVTVRFINAGHMDTVDHTGMFITDMIGL